MELTANYGFEKPEATDSPNGPLQVGVLADALDVVEWEADSIAVDAIASRDKIADAVIQTKRVSTGEVGTNSAKLVTVTWDTEWPDTNYTAQAILELGTGTASNGEPQVARLESKSKTQAKFVVENPGAFGSPFTGTLHAFAIHD